MVTYTDKVIGLALAITLAAGAIVGIFIARGVPAAMPPAAAVGIGEVTTEGLADEAVTTAKIANSAVTSAKIANGAVTSAKITDGTIVAADLADGAVTTAKIADGAVTSAKILNGTISSADIASGAIGTTEIEDGAVTSAKLADNTLTPGDIGFAPGSATFVVATSTDNGDFTDIQSAINALPPTGGLVHIKEGTYTITSTITVGDNVSIVGSGYSTHLYTTVAGNAISTTGNPAGVLIANLHLEGDGTNAVDGIYFSNADNSMIQGCWINNFTQDGIEISGGNNNIIRNNISEGNSQNGILLTSNAENNIATNNITRNNTWDGIRVASDNNLITSNSSHNNDKGIGASGNNNKLVGNFFYNNTTADIADTGTGTMYVGTSDIENNAISSAKLADNIQVDNLYVINIATRSGYDNVTMDNVVADNLRLTENFILPENTVPPAYAMFAPGAATYVVATSLDNGDFTDIQTAIGFLPPSGGLIYIKEGFYTISSSLNIGDNVSLIGSGYNTVLYVTVAGDGIGTTGTPYGILIANLHLVGDGTNADDGIQLTNATDSVIRECWIENFTEDGIELSGGIHITVKNNYISGNANNGMLVWGTDNSLITNNTIFQNSWDGIRIDGDADNNLVTSNHSFNNDKGIAINNANCDNNALGVNYTTGNATSQVDDSGTDTRNLSVETQSGQSSVRDGDSVSFAPHFPGTPNVVVTSENNDRIVGVENVAVGGFNVWVRKYDGTPAGAAEPQNNVQWIAVYTL